MDEFIHMARKSPYGVGCFCPTGERSSFIKIIGGPGTMISHSGRARRQMLAVALTIALSFQAALAGLADANDRTAKDTGARRTPQQPRYKLSPDLEETLQSAEQEETQTV